VLIERSVRKAQLAVIIMGSDRRDDGKIVVSSPKRERLGAPDEPRSDSEVLRLLLVLLADGDGGTVHVDLSDQGASPELIDERVLPR